MRANKYRLYPSVEQRDLLDKHFSAVRFVFNLALETKTWAYSSYKVNLSRYDLQVQLKELKKDCVWLKDINSQSLQAALLNLDIAYSNFFKGFGKFPKFKKKCSKQSFFCPQSVGVKKDKLFIPKFLDGIDIVLHRVIKGEIKSATVSKTATGKYFVSILTETGEKVKAITKIESDSSVGIDLGIKTFAALSDGVIYDNPKYLKLSLDRLKVLQKRASRKKKGGSNRKKANKRLCILHERVANQRKDFLHKVSDAITTRYNTIRIEDLSIGNMVKNRCVAQSITDSSWGMFVDFLKYKAGWKGKNVLKIGKFDPSSKLHNTCGHINKKLMLSDRQWVCPNCGELVLRDINAAINIKNFALLRISGVERTVEPAELPTLVGAWKQEK